MNGFEKHGLKHWSPSAVNLWINAPDVWVAEKLFKRRGSMGPAAWRGISVEQGVVNALSGMDFEAAVTDATEKFNSMFGLAIDDKVHKEREAIRPMIELAVQALEQYGKPDMDGGKQREVSITAETDDWSLPCKGFLDLPFDSHGLVVDLKTTMRMPSVMSVEHQRQRAVYDAATGNSDVAFLYVTPKKAEFRRDGDTSELLAEVKSHLIRLERFLRLGDSELLRQIVPVNPGSFYWTGAEETRRDLYGV